MAGRRLGQHFLRDRSVAARIVDSAGIKDGDVVVEVGPGKGALTSLILDRVQTANGMAVLVEIDPYLADALREKHRERDDVLVVCGDARDFSVREVLHGNLTGRGYKVIGNLPYYAGTPIVRGFLERDATDRPIQIVAMLQREVARDMCAVPGAMSLLSLAVQIRAHAEKLFDVGSEAFQPRPSVHSRVVRLTPLHQPRVAEDDIDDFFRVARAGFQGRRKQLHNSLSNGLSISATGARELLESVGIDSTRRPATLTIEEWVSLTKAWREIHSIGSTQEAPIASQR